MKIVLLCCAFLCWCAAGATPRPAESATVILVTPFAAAPEITNRELLNDVILAELSAQPSLQLVDRNALGKVLQEMALKDSAIVSDGQWSSIGKTLGARYFVTGNFRKNGEKLLIFCRLVDVETSRLKVRFTEIPAGADGIAQAQQMGGFIAQTIQDEKAARSPENVAAPFVLDPALPRPTVMTVIPELHIASVRLIDPAAETEVNRFLLAQNFPVVNVEAHQKLFADEKPATRQSTVVKYAKKQGAKFVIYGEAMSEAGPTFGAYHASRARVELKVIDVDANRILHSSSAYAGASDLGPVLAGKKAIQKASLAQLPELCRILAAAKCK